MSAIRQFIRLADNSRIIAFKSYHTSFCSAATIRVEFRNRRFFNALDENKTLEFGGPLGNTEWISIFYERWRNGGYLITPSVQGVSKIAPY